MYLGLLLGSYGRVLSKNVVMCLRVAMSRQGIYV